MEYLSSKTVSKKLGITAQTLRNWDRKGKIKPAYVNNNGYRYYALDDILSFMQKRKTEKEIYAIDMEKAKNDPEFIKRTLGVQKEFEKSDSDIEKLTFGNNCEW